MPITLIIALILTSLCFITSAWRWGMQHGINKANETNLMQTEKMLEDQHKAWRSALDKISIDFRTKIAQLEEAYINRIQYSNRDPLDSDTFLDETIWISEHCYPQKVFVLKDGKWVVTAELFPITPTKEI